MRIRGDRLTWREIDGEIVALDLMSNTYFTANRTGSVLIRQLAEDVRTEELVVALTDTFEVSADDAQADVDAFLVTLDRHGLLVRD